MEISVIENAAAEKKERKLIRSAPHYKYTATRVAAEMVRIKISAVQGGDICFVLL